MGVYMFGFPGEWGGASALGVNYWISGQETWDGQYVNVTFVNDSGESTARKISIDAWLTIGEGYPPGHPEAGQPIVPELVVQSPQEAPVSQDTDNFYGFPVVTQSSALVPAGAVALSALPVVVQTAVRALGLAPGSLLRWPMIGSAIRAILVALGITQAIDIFIDDAPGGIDIPFAGPGGLIPIGGGSFPPQWGQAYVAKTWNAGGTPFAMAVDGMMAARRKNGVWTIWKPEKPVVITRGMKVRDMLRADKRLNTQSKRIRKMLDRRSPRRPARKEAPITVTGRGDDVVIHK